MSINKKIRKSDNVIQKKNDLSDFLFKEEDDKTSIPQPTIQKREADKDNNVVDTLKNSIQNTQDDIKNDKTKKDEINKVLSVTKDTYKRNYLSKQMKDKGDEIAKKGKLLSNQQDSLKKQEEETKKPDSEKKVVKQILNTPSTDATSSSDTSNINEVMLRKKINEMIQNNFNGKKPASKPIIKKHVVTPSQEPIQTPVKKNVRVTFDKSTGKPWKVLFTERGFLVGNTRFGFETIEMAINKNYNIVLDGGEGMTLDQVKLNKILKYKDKI